VKSPQSSVTLVVAVIARFKGVRLLEKRFRLGAFFKESDPVLCPRQEPGLLGWAGAGRICSVRVERSLRRTL
jgi:hypothetical protein